MAFKEERLKKFSEAFGDNDGRLVGLYLSTVILETLLWTGITSTIPRIAKLYSVICCDAKLAVLVQS